MSDLSGVTQDEVRRHNLARLLRLLHRHGPHSRSQLVAITGLNRSTVGVLVSELVDARLARETEGVGQGVGRPSLVVELIPDSAVVLAFDARVDRSVAAMVGLGGVVMERRSRSHRRDSYSVSAATKQLERLAQSVLESAPRRARWVGAAVGVPGVVRRTDGLVRFASNLGWVDAPFGESLSEALSFPVTVGNDANLGVLAEHVRGAAVGVDDVLYLSGGVGVGGGLMIDGRLMSGAGGYGGEVGHMVVNPKGRLCRCGSRGCWETEIGRDAVLRAAGYEPERWPQLDEMEVVRDPDPQVRAGVRRVGVWLGLGIANLVNLFNPEVVILGGLLREIYPVVSDVVEQQLDRALPASREQVRVTLPQLGGDSTLLGAAESAFADLLDDPLGVLSRSKCASA